MTHHWDWIRGPGQRGHADHSRWLNYAGDAQTPIGINLFLPAGHRWEIIPSPNRGDSSYGFWVAAEERCHSRATLLWAHLSQERLRIGRIYNGGIKLGETGNSGGSTGPHLHFETDRDFWRWADRIWSPHGETKEWDEMATKAEIQDAVRAVVRDEVRRWGEAYAEWAMAAITKTILGREMPTGYGGDLRDTYIQAIGESFDAAAQRERAQHP